VTDRDRDRDSGRDRETWDGGRDRTYKQTQTQTWIQKFDGEKEASLLHHGGGKKSGRERDTPPEVAVWYSKNVKYSSSRIEYLNLEIVLFRHFR